jgi:hypothetical protein
MREGRRPQGLTRLRLATLDSVRGLRHCYRSEATFGQEFPPPARPTTTDFQ